MKEKQLGYKVSLRNGLPEEYYSMNIEGNDRQLAYELFKELKDGEIHTVELRTKTDFDNYEQVRMVRLYVGKVTPVTYKPIFPKRLTFWKRIKVLFTGEVSFEIGYDR